MTHIKCRSLEAAPLSWHDVTTGSRRANNARTLEMEKRNTQVIERINDDAGVRRLSFETRKERLLVPCTMV